MTPEIYPKAVKDYMLIELGNSIARDVDQNGPLNDRQQRNYTFITGEALDSFMSNPAAVTTLEKYRQAGLPPHDTAMIVLMGYLRLLALLDTNRPGIG